MTNIWQCSQNTSESGFNSLTTNCIWSLAGNCMMIIMHPVYFRDLSHGAKEALKEYDRENGNTLNQKAESGAKPKKKGFMDKLKENLEDL